jgi:hypothetical protein
MKADRSNIQAVASVCATSAASVPDPNLELPLGGRLKLLALQAEAA